MDGLIINEPNHFGDFGSAERPAAISVVHHKQQLKLVFTATCSRVIPTNHSSPIRSNHTVSCSAVILLHSIRIALAYSNLNTSVFSLRRRLSMWHCPLLLLSAGACCTAPAAHPQLSVIDILCPQGAQQQTRWPLLLLPIYGTYRRTDIRPIHRPCSAHHAGSVNKNQTG